MEPSHPPYESGALTTPRQLQRWLDVNPQNGPLTRTQTFVTLPAFSVNVEWLGYSDIVATFNYEAPNNFSFTQFVGSIPSTPNYCLCVSYRNTDNSVVRYALWRDVGEIFYFDAPVYTGQLIKKNFRLEVWSINGALASQTTDLNFFTSVLGSLDYRYGVDTELVGDDGIVLDFETPVVAIISSPTLTGLTYWYNAALGLTGDPVSQWESQTTSYPLVQAVGANQPDVSTGPPQSIAFGLGSGNENIGRTAIGGTVNKFYITISPFDAPNNTQILLYSNSDASLVVTITNVSDDSFDININGTVYNFSWASGVSSNNFLIEVGILASTLLEMKIYDIAQAFRILYEQIVLVSPITSNSIGQITLGDSSGLAGVGTEVFNFLLRSSAIDANSMKYLFQYNNIVLIDLPLEFPDDAVSTINE